MFSAALCSMAALHEARREYGQVCVGGPETSAGGGVLACPRRQSPNVFAACGSNTLPWPLLHVLRVLPVCVPQMLLPPGPRAAGDSTAAAAAAVFSGQLSVCRHSRPARQDPDGGTQQWRSHTSSCRVWCGQQHQQQQHAQDRRLVWVARWRRVCCHCPTGCGARHSAVAAGGSRCGGVW
jgi:hypothetical protein